MEMTVRILAIAAGGALGANARYWSTLGLNRLLGTGMPWATILINATGSLAIGAGFVLVERWQAGHLIKGFVMVGLLGGFTTFSTFSLETLSLWERGASLRAVGNVALSVALSLTAVAIGATLARQVVAFDPTHDATPVATAEDALDETPES